jgi:hypothetical protein
MRIFYFIYSLFHLYFSYAQGVGVGTLSPDPSSIFHIFSNNQKAILIPRLSQTQINSINPSSNGLILYNETFENLEYFNGNDWIKMEPLPSGSIIMWSGSISDLPSGWVLCDGKSYDLDGSVKSDGINSPDLRNSFIVGYLDNDPEYGKILNSGGLNHVALDSTQIPNHTHTINTHHSHEVEILNSNHDHT